MMELIVSLYGGYLILLCSSCRGDHIADTYFKYGLTIDLYGFKNMFYVYECSKNT